MYLQCKQSGENFDFFQVKLKFVEGIQTNTFSLKNNKTVRQTIEHRRYLKLEDETKKRFGNDMDKPLGEFLLELKIKGDPFYKRFLNSYGDSDYSAFSIAETSALNQKGIYAYTSQDDLVYVGRCRDMIGKRINHGYGKIHPKNCYIDGQATNCHLNSLITSKHHSIRFWLHPLKSDNQIIDAERRLIRSYSPAWNLHRFL